MLGSFKENNISDDGRKIQKRSGILIQAPHSVTLQQEIQRLIILAVSTFDVSIPFGFRIQTILLSLVLIFSASLSIFFPSAHAQTTEQISYPIIIDGPPLVTSKVPAPQANPDQEMSRLENQLYGQTYARQSMDKRLSRTERTVLGSPQSGSVPDRLAKIEDHIKEKRIASPTGNKTELILNYLEQKLFQRDFNDQPVEYRIKQLESHVFGRNFENYSLDIRLKKLTYAFPVVAREVRLTTMTDKVIAVASPQNKKAPGLGRSLSAVPEMLPAESQTESIVNTGNYFESIFKFSSGKYLRWVNLPVRVYIQNTNSLKQRAASQAVSLWEAVFPISQTQFPHEADIVVDFDDPPGKDVNNASMLSNQFGNEQKTLLSIHMGVYNILAQKNADHPEEFWTRALLHQLGHSLGLWGHSNNPQDIMYPFYKVEALDIPIRWNRRSTIPAAFSSTLPDDASIKPSQRDINTLTQIYSLPGENLKYYIPVQTRW